MGVTSNTKKGKAYAGVSYPVCLRDLEQVDLLPVRDVGWRTEWNVPTGAAIVHEHSRFMGHRIISYDEPAWWV